MIDPDGWLKLWRRVLNSVVWKNKNLWRTWSWCLLKASHKKHKTIIGFQVIELDPGQFIFGRKKASKETGHSEQTIKTTMNRLKKLQKLTIKPTNKFSIVTIINWDSYQGQQNKTNQQTNQEVTSKSPASNHKQECKNDIKKEKEKLPCAEEPFYITKKGNKLTGKRLESFNQFWKAFAYPKGKADAAESWYQIPFLTEPLVLKIINAAKREAIDRKKLSPDRTPKMAQGWLTSRRWEDEAPKKGTGHGKIVC